MKRQINSIHPSTVANKVIVKILSVALIAHLTLLTCHPTHYQKWWPMRVYCKLITISDRWSVIMMRDVILSPDIGTYLVCPQKLLCINVAIVCHVVRHIPYCMNDILITNIEYNFQQSTMLIFQ